MPHWLPLNYSQDHHLAGCAFLSDFWFYSVLSESDHATWLHIVSVR